MRLSKAQLDALRSYAADMEAPDYAEYAERAGALGWRNRERVITALIRKGLLDADQQLTDAGRAELAEVAA